MAVFCIDNGHDNVVDKGSMSKTGQPEGKTNYNVAYELVKLLYAAGHEAFLTNPNLKHMSINDRAMLANGKEADVTISVHHNKSKTNNAKGSEVFYEIRDKKSKILAECVAAELGKWNGISRGIKVKADSRGNDYYGMLRLPRSINIIGEGAFMDCSEIGKIDTYLEQKAEAEAYFRGIMKALPLIGLS